MHDEFAHVRVIIGLVAGLTITRLLTGLARFVQHPSRQQIYAVHIGWAVYLLLSVMLFWWFEYSLVMKPIWTFHAYMFVIGYASLYFFTSTILFPDRMDEYAGFEQYFHSRQHWFYGLLAAIFLVDIADSAGKGIDHLTSLGRAYLWRQPVLAALALVAIFVRNRRFHAAFLIVALGTQIWLIARHFDVLD